MGQAKRRGNKDQRIADAQARDASMISMAEMKAKVGLPDSAEFLGYVVHVIETDDYLAAYDERPAMTKRAYSPTPDHAIRYDDFHEAIAIAKKLPKESIVGLMFDVGDQFQVFFDREI